jgi:cobalt/nickel transport system ATP-binding protein
MLLSHGLDASFVEEIAGRVVVLGEDRRVIADGAVAHILGDRELLVRANLIHQPLHPSLGSVAG